MSQPGSAPGSTWRKETFAALANDYRQLILFTREFPEVLAVISNKVLPSTYQGLATYILKACGDVQTKIFVMRKLIDAEFEYAKHDFTKFMREKSRLPNRVTGSFVLGEGSGYLKLLLGNLVEEILQNKTVSFEVDPEKNRKDILKNRLRLTETAQKFIDRITSKDMIAEIPPSIRALLAVIAEEAEKYDLQDKVEILVGNMLVLRFITPAIAIPEYYGTSPADCIPTSRARRNLVLVSKLIQSLANQVLPSSSEEYMAFFDKFFKDNLERFKTYIRCCINDPKLSKTDSEESKEHKYGWDSFLTGLKPKELESVKIVGTYTLRELAVAHRVLYNNVSMIKMDVHEMMRNITRYTEFEARMDELLKLLGTPVLIGPEPYIDPDHPEVKEYMAEKINKRGKRQQRVIKFTNNGFVNIKRTVSNPSGGTKIEGGARLQNEVLITDIKEYIISEYKSDVNDETLYRITLKFDPSAPNVPKQVGYFPPSNGPAKRPPRVYDFTSQRTRDEVLGEMFELCFASPTLVQPLAFELIKINKYGKAQARVFKLSRDSLMNLKGQDIKTELHFSMIEYVRIDSKNRRGFYMKVRDEEFVRCNMCKDEACCLQLVKELETGIQRFERE